MKILLIGGSGFVSGRLARIALQQSHEVWAVTRGARPMHEHVHAVVADRNDRFGLMKALQACDTKWDAVIDCICFNAGQAQVDLDILPAFTDRLIVISTDSVYHPAFKQVPQDENGTGYMADGGYGAQKREMELAFMEADTPMRISLLRPGHIFGPGSKLGCFPEHSRQDGLIDRIRDGQPLRLVGGGRYLIQPIYVDDLCRVMLCLAEKPQATGIFCVGGPDVVTNADYFRMLGEILGREIIIEEIPEEGYLETHPECSGHLCNRSYTQARLASFGVPLPATTLREGLTEQVKWILEHETK